MFKTLFFITLISGNLYGVYRLTNLPKQYKLVDPESISHWLSGGHVDGDSADSGPRPWGPMISALDYIQLASFYGFRPS